MWQRCILSQMLYPLQLRAVSGSCRSRWRLEEKKKKFFFVFFSGGVRDVEARAGEISRFLRCAPIESSQSGKNRFIRGFKGCSLGCALWLAAVFGHWLWTPLSAGNTLHVTHSTGSAPSALLLLHPAWWLGSPPHSQHELMILWLWHCAPLLQISVDECGFGWNTDQICYNDWVLWSGYSCTNKLSLLLIVFPYLFSRECLQNTQDVLFFFFQDFPASRSYSHTIGWALRKKEEEVRGFAARHFSSPIEIVHKTSVSSHQLSSVSRTVLACDLLKQGTVVLLPLITSYTFTSCDQFNRKVMVSFLFFSFIWIVHRDLHGSLTRNNMFRFHLCLVFLVHFVNVKTCLKRWFIVLPQFWLNIFSESFSLI